MLTDKPFEFGDLGFVGVRVPIACKGVAAVLTVEFAPRADGVRVNLMFAGGLGNRFACFYLAQHLQCELAAELSPFCR